jgi:hypothetical protein
MMTRRALWRLTGLCLLVVVLVVWRQGVLWTVFFAPGMAALDLMALLPVRIANGITYGIHPEGGASSAIPLVAVVSMIFWTGLLLAWWTYRRRKRFDI